MLMCVMRNTRRTALVAITVAAGAAAALPTTAAAAPKTDADLAKSVGCGYAASVEVHAAGAGGSSYTSKVISRRGSIYVVECEVRTAKPGNSTMYFNDPEPGAIYRVTVDANNRFFVVGAEGPHVPSVRPPAPARAA